MSADVRLLAPEADFQRALPSFRNEAAFSEHARRFFVSLAPFGLEAYHTKRSEHSAPGFPDWIVLIPDWGWAIEQKVGKRAATPDQRRWLAAFGRLPNWTAELAYPSDWPRIRDDITNRLMGVRK